MTRSPCRSRVSRAREPKPEFAFRVTADVAPAEIEDPDRMAEIAVLHPAIEIIGNRYLAKGLDAERNSLMTVADNGGGIGFVFGAPVEDWQGVDLLNHEVRVSVDGGAPSDNFLGNMRGVAPAGALRTGEPLGPGGDFSWRRAISSRPAPPACPSRSPRAVASRRISERSEESM